MNHSNFTYNSNTYSKYYGSHPSGNVNYQPSSTWVNFRTKVNNKAYINPNILNYKNIIQDNTGGSLLMNTKIHINPNFRRNKVVDLRTNSERVSNDLNNSINTNLADAVIRNRSALSVNKEGSSTVSSPTKCFVNLKGAKWSEHNLQSKYCLTKSYSQPLYKWSKVNSDSDNRSFLLPEKYIKKEVTPISRKTKIIIKKPALCSRFKYVASNKALKIIHSDSEINTKFSTTSIKPKISKVVNTDVSKCKEIKLNIPNHVKNTYNRNKSLLKMASLVRNKYKYIKLANASGKTIYKIDKRKELPQIANKKHRAFVESDIRKLFPRNKYLRLNNGLISKNCLKWKKLSVNNETKLTKHHNFTNRRIVKIGGIFYKSTTKSLTLANKCKNNTIVTCNKTLGNSRHKLKKNHIVYVRGEKFLLDKNGKRLLRQSNTLEKNKCSTTFKRIDIGGVTYLRKSNNVLIRTNVHQARHIVNQAKQKSIHTLCLLRKRSSLPCMIFHKFGKCIRHNKGLCIYKHDPKNIAICKKFLKGNCDDNNCSLSHETVQEKMATCHFYLNGCCSRENCQFLHVKLSKKADICKNFLHGFCNLGKNCSKRHLFQCPSYDKYGKCSLGRKCLYPHKSKNSFDKDASDCSVSEDLQKNNQTVKYDVNIETVSSAVKRKTNGKSEKIKQPILKLSDLKNTKSDKKDRKRKRKSTLLTSSPTENMNDIDIIPKRVKLNHLPHFIPLSSTSNNE